MYDRNDSLVGWMIAGGSRFDEPDARTRAHLIALRDARREDRQAASPLAWLVERLGWRSSDPTAQATATSCCTA